MRNIRQNLWVVLFFAVLTLIGLWTAPDYGLPCDEPAEQVILQQNMKEYAFQLLGPQSGAVRYYDAIGIQRISESVERDHGQSAYYAAVPLLSLAANAPDLLLIRWHQYTWLWFMVGVISLYGLMRGFSLSRALACATAMFLYLSPRFFAEGHYNNKDVVLLSLVLLTLATGSRFLRDPTYPRAFWFSLAGALATNTKIVGLYAWGLVGLAMLIPHLVRKTMSAHRWRVGLAAIGYFIAFYTLLTPALWADPPGYFAYVLGNATGFSRWTGVVLFGGTLYDPTRGFPLPRRYLPTMVLLTTPLPFALLAAIGQTSTLLRCKQQDEPHPMRWVLTLLWIVPMLFVILARPLLYNGWRHFYFLYAGLSAMGGLGLQALEQRIGGRRILRVSGAIALVCVLVWQAVGIFLNHPYQYAYYNPLVQNVQTTYELDYWDVSTVNAMRRLCDLQGAAEQPLLLGTRDEMSAFGVSHGYTALTAEQRRSLTLTEDPNAPYLLMNTTYTQIYGVPQPDGYHTLFTLESYGHTICTVYQTDTLEQTSVR